MMINIDGFTPIVDTHKLHRTYGFTNCAYCGVPMSIFDERYLFDNKPICRSCLIKVYEYYGINIDNLSGGINGDKWICK